MDEKAGILWGLRVVAALALAVVLAWPLDWAVWELRSAKLDTVTVSQFTTAALKGGKESYLFDGTTTLLCSRSVFPQGGSSPCWWLQRHAEIIHAY